MTRDEARAKCIKAMKIAFLHKQRICGDAECFDAAMNAALDSIATNIKREKDVEFLKGLELGAATVTALIILIAAATGHLI